MNQALSGPAFRTVLRIVREWNLDERELRAILGGPTPLTLRTWSDAARGRRPLTLPPEALRRITWLIQIHLVLGADPVWLRSPCETLGHRSPMAHILAHPDGLKRSRDALLLFTKGARIH